MASNPISSYAVDQLVPSTFEQPQQLPQLTIDPHSNGHLAHHHSLASPFPLTSPFPSYSYPHHQQFFHYPQPFQHFYKPHPVYGMQYHNPPMMGTALMTASIQRQLVTGLPSPTEESMDMHTPIKKEPQDYTSAAFRKEVGERPYVCTYSTCDKSFTQLGNLKTHERKHTGEKPYKGCEKVFSQMGNMKTHELLHSGVKPYTCSIDGCARSFTQLGNLKQKLHHATDKRVKREDDQQDPAAILKKMKKGKRKSKGLRNDAFLQWDCAGETFTIGEGEEDDHENYVEEEDVEVEADVEAEVKLMRGLKAVISKAASEGETTYC